MISFSNSYGYMAAGTLSFADCNGRREDSCGISGTGETPQALWRRGGSPPAPRKAKRLEWKSIASTHSLNQCFACRVHWFSFLFMQRT
ncbi:hypothetical protein A3781_06330 [Bacillus badius]|nr:hypothetical protein A3781_06330 [Bacillus badius]